jgi:ABC-type transporter Mla subunit MlaD
MEGASDVSKAFPTALQRLKQVEQERDELRAQVATLLQAIQDYNAAWLNEKEPGLSARVEVERIQATHIQRKRLFDVADKTPQDAAQYVRGLENAATYILEQHRGNPDDAYYPVPCGLIRMLAEALTAREQQS